jgi:hypothetical protein
MVHWGELVLEVPCTDHAVRRAADPIAIDMGRVAATEQIVDALCDRRLDLEAAARALAAVSQRPSVSLLRFAVMAAAGATALGVIFGAADEASLALIALSAGAGACLRKALSRISRNPFVQPLFAALLAGAIGSAVAMFHLTLYLPLLVMLAGLILRGVALGYALLGACWLIKKCGGGVRDSAYRLVPYLSLGLLAFLLTVFVYSLGRESQGHGPLAGEAVPPRFPGDRGYRGRRDGQECTRSSRRRTIPHGRADLCIGVCDAGHFLLALHDPVLDHDQGCGRAAFQPGFHVLGRRPLRLSARCWVTPRSTRPFFGARSGPPPTVS